MGKLARMIYKSDWELTGNVAGRVCYLHRESPGRDQRSACQFPTEEWYQGCDSYVPDVFFGPGVLCCCIAASVLIRTDFRVVVYY